MSTSNNASNGSASNVEDVPDADNQMDLLMRHSSPLVIRTNVTSPATERNSSPSPLFMSRPRSNPRNRTPMRFESPLNTNAFRIPEDEEEADRPATNEGRRITIRPMAGRAVGTTVALNRGREAQPTQIFKSRKQGPSHRKIRRWNNDNFVNLAAEIRSGKGGSAAAEVLMKGSADASKYRSILDPNDHKSDAMKKFLDDDKLKGVREQFFEGGMNQEPKRSRDHKPSPKGPVTSEQMLNRIDARLRRVVVKACENSAPASKVVETLESFILRAYNNKSDKTSKEVWDEILLEPPTMTHRKRDDTYVTRFLFDGDSANGGFHRLLLHGLCQFHGLRATSSTMQLMRGDKNTNARLLTATGKISGPDIRLVDYIMQRLQPESASCAAEVEKATNQMAAVKI